MGEVKQGSSMAVFSLISGILGVVLVPVGLLVPLALILAAIASIVAIVLGILELKAIKEGKVPESGRLFGILGMAGGGLGCLLQIGMLLVVLVVVGVMVVNS